MSKVKAVENGGPESSGTETLRQLLTREPHWPTAWVDQWFDHLRFGLPSPAALLGRFGDVEPARIEQFTSNGDLVIRAEMPGIVDDDDISVSIAGDKLTVSAKRVQHSEASDEGSFQSEFRYGAFSRTVTVPPETSPDDITAEYVDGILEVRVPTEGGDQSDRRSIAVKRS